MAMEPSGGCLCGSGIEGKECCGAPTSHAPRATDSHPRGYLVTLPAGARDAVEGERSERGRGRALGPAMVAALEQLHAALQEPRGDVACALAGLTPPWDPDHPGVAESIDQVLFHGHTSELIAWLPSVVARPVGRRFEALTTMRSLRAIACELVIDRFAAAGAGPSNDVALLAEIGPFAEVPPDELRHRVVARGQLPAGALDRSRYRHDRDGADVVPLLEALTIRFAHLLVTHWSWSLSRSLLARRELDMLLLERLDPRFDLERRHVCRECAIDRRPRRDLGRGATVLALDVNLIILTWPRRMTEIGGPYRGAAMLEALPLWVQFIEALRLLDRLPARRMAAATDRLARILAPSLGAEATRRRDRALAAAAHRLAQGRAAAS